MRYIVSTTNHQVDREGCELQTNKGMWDSRNEAVRAELPHSKSPSRLLHDHCKAGVVRTAIANVLADL